jgi:hypothetical protein
MAYPGLDYDPIQDRIVAWIGGNTVYTLDMDTRQWSTVTYSGGPGSPNGTGTYKRWSYSPLFHGFVLVNKYDQNAYTFRFPGSTIHERPKKSNQGFGVQVSPNPFTTTVKIAVSCLPSAISEAKLNIFNVNGKIVKKLTATDSRQLIAGINWNTAHLPCGLYLLKITTPGKTITKRLSLQK